MKIPIITTAVAAILVIAAAWAVSEHRRTHHDGRSGIPAAEADAPPEFALTASDGRSVTAASLRGTVCLIYFGFTTCPDVCPTELGWMMRTLRQLGPIADAVQPIFISVDPERDTPAKLSAYAAAFHPRMLALTGTPDQVKAAADAFGVVYRKQTPVSQQPGFYLIDHTMTTFVLDREGRIVHRLASADTTPEQAAAMLRALAGGAP
ncbi:MAG: SCO family protein [Planctomycetes bacterium]|nr:SCO family protein [Planctomycetota bacterium]